MLGGVAELAEGREVTHGFTPPSDPIRGQPGQLPHVGDGRRFVGHGLDGSQRILEAAPVEGAERGLGPLDQALAVGGGGHVCRLADLGGHVGRQGVPARQCGQCGTGTAGVPAAVRAVGRGGSAGGALAAALAWYGRGVFPFLAGPVGPNPTLLALGGWRGVLAALALVDGIGVARPTLGVTLAGHLAGAAPGHIPPLLGAPGQRGGGVLVAARPFRGVPGARPAAWSFRVPLTITVTTAIGSTPSGCARTRTRCGAASGGRTCPGGAGPRPRCARSSSRRAARGSSVTPGRRPCPRAPSRCAPCAGAPARRPARVVAPRTRASTPTGRRRRRPSSPGAGAPARGPGAA